MAHQIRCAVKNRDHALLEKLLKRKNIDVNQIIGGSTPLGLAVYFGDAVSTEMLLKAGADPNIRMAIIDIQCEYQTAGAEPPLTYLVRKSTPRNLNLSRLLLDHGANASAVDTSSFTPLFYAAARDDAAFAALLLEHGADVGKFIGGVSADHEDRMMLQPAVTVLHVAFDDGRREVAETILKHLKKKGALADIVDRDGNTILHHLVRSGLLEEAEDLLRRFCGRSKTDPGEARRVSAFVNAVNSFGETALLLAVKASAFYLANSLMILGSDSPVEERIYVPRCSVSRALFVKVCATPESAEATRSLNLYFASGQLKNLDDIWLEDVDEAFDDLAEESSLSEEVLQREGVPLLERMKISSRAPLKLRDQARLFLRRYVDDEELPRLNGAPKWIRDFVAFKL